jgi:hypothetical protein
MSNETYNGWANRETWTVALYINNDGGLQESVFELVRDLVEQHDREQYDGCTDCRQGDHSQDCGSDLDAVERISPTFVGEQIRERLDELFDVDTHDGILPRDVVSMMQDIGSLWRVDWHEIGAAFLTDVQEQGDTHTDCAYCEAGEGMEHNPEPHEQNA